MSNTIGTVEAAKRLEMSRNALVNWLWRNPEYKPDIQIGNMFLWTSAEIEAVRQRRIELRSRKRSK